MKLPSWASDTIARRFAVTEVLAVAVTLASEAQCRIPVPYNTRKT